MVALYIFNGELRKNGIANDPNAQYVSFFSWEMHKFTMIVIIIMLGPKIMHVFLSTSI